MCRDLHGDSWVSWHLWLSAPLVPYVRFCRIKALSGNMLFFAMLPDYVSDPKNFKRLHYPVDIMAQCVRW